MLLMVEKLLDEEYFTLFLDMQKVITNALKSYLQYWNVNNLCGWKMLQKLPVNNFEWIKDASQFNEDFIKN